jgi:Mg-chelatase subunit ChlI
MGVNMVEREGISHSHPSQFVLIGTMNPEEGDLRPQLLDRFGLAVDVQGEHDVESRIDVIKSRLAFEESPQDFVDLYQKEQDALMQTLSNARVLLPQVQFDEKLYELIATISTTLGVDGHRADIIMVKTALAHAAFNNRTEVTKDDIYSAAELVLPHRMRRLPFEESEFCAKKLQSLIEENITAEV